MKKIAFPVLLSALLSASPVAVAGPMQAGLWEVTVKSDAMKGMPKMSAQQMAQMKKMGIAVPQMSDGGMVSKICITPEMAAREQPPMEQQKDCQARNMRQSGNVYTMDIVCTGPELKGKGTVKATYDSNTSFRSTYKFRGTSHGHPVNQSHDSSGTWLGSDCGDVKPVAN